MASAPGLVSPVLRFLPFLAAALLAAAAWAGDGIDVGKPSALRNLVPAGAIEQSAATQYGDLKRQAAEKGALAPETHPQLRRLRAIAGRIIPQAGRYNPRAGQWHWEVNLIGSKQINAFCMPGGKIAFYTGIIETLKLSDDEVAIVMGHEMAHALREHARKQMAKNELTRLGTSVIGQLVAKGRYADMINYGGNLLSLKFSREDESEADLVGLDLAARAGYDPRAGVTLWEKMAAASKGAPPQWLSTHPSGSNRIKEIENHLPEVMPLYEQAARTRAQSDPVRSGARP